MTEKVLYTALILDASSHKALVSWFARVSGKPLLDMVYAHHATIKFKPTEGEVACTSVGLRAYCIVTGWAADASTQAVTVVGLEVASGVPHVTVACAQGTSPVRSLDLLGRGYNECDGPLLSGRIEAVMSN